MEKTNSVYLDGSVASCDILSNGNGETVAGITFITLVPKSGVPKDARLSERYDMMRHLVMVMSETENDPDLLELERSCREEKRLRPYKLRGRLMEVNGDSVVVCRVEDLSQTRNMGTRRNNNCSLVGPVVNLGHSDDFATMVLDTGVCNVRTFFPKKTFKDAYAMIAEGRLRKGTFMDVSGPLMSQEYTDGKTRMHRVLVVPHAVKQVKLAKKREQGMSRKTGRKPGGR